MCHHGSWLLTLLCSSNISWWLGSTESAARQSLSAPNTSPLCSWNAALRCKRCKSALNAMALESSAIASSSFRLSINTTNTTPHHMCKSNKVKQHTLSFSVLLKDAYWAYFGLTYYLSTIGSGVDSS
ncbi:hypothetical protein AAHE18_06G104200 [Arachis hypogaea]